MKILNKLIIYKNLACIVHLGKSVGSGHYVCYIRKNNEWIYYNDEKVYKI